MSCESFDLFRSNLSPSKLHGEGRAYGLAQHHHPFPPTLSAWALNYGGVRSLVFLPDKYSYCLPAGVRRGKWLDVTSRVQLRFPQDFWTLSSPILHLSLQLTGVQRRLTKKEGKLGIIVLCSCRGQYQQSVYWVPMESICWVESVHFLLTSMLACTLDCSGTIIK